MREGVVSFPDAQEHGYERASGDGTKKGEGALRKGEGVNERGRGLHIDHVVPFIIQ